MEKEEEAKMNKTKRNVTLAVVLVCVCAAIYLNWSYNNQKPDEDAFADASLADAKAQEETPVSVAGGDDYISEYFAQARLTRQQSRDEALNLLEKAAMSETASQEIIDTVMSSIAVMANYSMQETQIENLLLAKDFAECVAFMSADGVTVAVPAPAEGLTADQVAKITDAIISETNYTAEQIRLIEVKKPTEESPAPETSAEPSGDSAESSLMDDSGPLELEGSEGLE